MVGIVSETTWNRRCSLNQLTTRSFVSESKQVGLLRTKDRRMTVKKYLNAFLRNEEGLTIVEYAVAAGLVTAAVVASFTLLGGTVDGVIQFLILNI